MRFIKTYWSSIFVALLILYVSVWSTPPFRTPSISHFDKWGHLGMYLVLGLLAQWNTWRYCISRRWLRIVLVFLTTSAYGGLIELIQAFFCATRTGSWMDLAADMVGVVIGIVCVESIIAIRKKEIQ